MALPAISPAAPIEPSPRARNDSDFAPLDSSVRSSAATQDSLVAVGDAVHRRVRFSEREVASFAAIVGDWNPLHHDAEAALRSRFGEKIASGAQTSSLLMGLATSHFSRNTDGFARQAVALNFNFSFKAPIFAEEEVALHWKVHQREWNTKLDGWVAHLEGAACTERAGTALVARAVLLVKSPG